MSDWYDMREAFKAGFEAAEGEYNGERPISYEQFIDQEFEKFMRERNEN